MVELHGGAIQVKSQATCDCQNTSFTGKYCEKPDKKTFKKSCAEYYASGFKTNGIYLLGKLTSFNLKSSFNLIKLLGILSNNK